MVTALYVIAILGCGEGTAPCQEVRTVEARYESREACTAATPAQLERFADVDFPVVVAQCREAGAPAAPVQPADVLLPKPERTPHFRTAGAARPLRT